MRAARRSTIGSFWVDVTRSLTRVLIPLSIIGALVLVSQGAVQNFYPFRTVSTLAGATQTIPGGPVSSMEVIKLLGTNGGSFYGVGGAHPFENPTGFSNIWELLLVIVLPFAIVFMFGRLIGSKRQAYAIVAVMAVGELGGPGPESVTVRAVSGQPAQALIEASADADLVVVGSRGAGGFATLLTGSVSSKVVNHAACPVVVVRH